MVKLLRFSSVLLICFLAFVGTPLFGQGITTACLGDTIKPVLERCPQNIVLTTLDSCQRVQWTNPVASDNCSIPSVTSNYQSGTCFKLGATPVIFTATDAAGNKASCYFVITVTRPNLDSLCASDTIKPTFLNCPANSTITSLDSCVKVQWTAPVAVDNCGTPVVTSNLSVPGTSPTNTTLIPCFKLGATLVAYTATDLKGNKAICSFTVTVVRPNTDSICLADTTKPHFTNCPVNSTFTSLDSCLRIQWITPTAVDNCGVPTVTSSAASGTCFGYGSTTVVNTATDAKGNKAICSFTITVVRPNLDSLCAADTTKPYFLNCPPNSTFTTSDTCMRVQWSTVLAADNCGTPTVTSDYISGSCFKIGTTPVLYTATDAKGNKGLCAFSITVVRSTIDVLCANDTIKPRFTTCPVSSIFTTLDSCVKTQWAIPNAYDNCSTPTVTGNYTSGSCFKIGTTQVVYTATDAKGNKGICSFSVTVIHPLVDSLCATDTVKPRFVNCPANLILTSFDSCTRVQWATPAAIDNCSTPRVTTNYAPGSCFNAGITPVVYTATDAKGNISTCSFTVTVINPCATDTTKPRFAFCPQNIVVSSLDTCARVQWGTPYASDNCSTPTVVGNYESGTCFKTGVTTVTYTATDAKKNSSTCAFTVTVINPCATDTTKPLFVSCPQNISIVSTDSCSKVQWSTPYAIDNCSTPTVVGNYQSGTCFKAGVTPVTFTATDAKGNASTCAFTVTVINPCAGDTTKPSFVFCPQSIIVNSLDSCARVQWVTPAAIDNCSRPTVVGNYQSGSCFKAGVTPISYTATDAKGNSSTCAFTVTVVNPCAGDTIKPRFISCPQNIVISTLDSCAKAQWSTPYASDNCSTPIVTGNYQSGACFKPGITSVVLTATDARGNATTCTFTVMVINPCANDTTKPIFYNCPANIVRETFDTTAAVTWIVPSAADNCGVKTRTESLKPGALFKIGTTNVSYTATDASGNTGNCSFTVTVRQVVSPCTNDTIAPTFTNCPANLTLTTASTAAIGQWVKPTATDNCTPPSVTTTANPGSGFPIGTTVVTYKATDARLNTSYCTFNIVVTKAPLVIDSTLCYILVSRSSKKALSINNASTALAADAIQWTYSGGLNQKWAITKADSNSVNLTVKHTNLNLDTRWGTTDNNTRLMQWAKSAASLTQKWQLVALPDGYFKVINKASGRALSVSGGTLATSDGSLVLQSDYLGLTSQQWSIEAVSCTTASTTPGTTPVSFTNNDLLEVSAKPELHRARIEWVNNTGYKNDYYEVEKLNATTGKFESLTVINNTQFDNQPVSQSVYDENPADGDNIYRVKVAYLDSLTKVSNIQKVTFNSLETIKVFPNPTTNFVDVDLTTYGNDAVTVSIYNGFGQVVATQNNNKANIVHFDLSSQQAGSYLIRVTSKGKRDVTKPLQIIR